MKVGPTLQALQEQYGNDLKVVYKHFVVHPGSATVPALAACAVAGCAGSASPCGELGIEIKAAGSGAAAGGAGEGRPLGAGTGSFCGGLGPLSSGPGPDGLL